MTELTARSIPCPDCLAPAGQACRMSSGWDDGSYHAARITNFELRQLPRGVCALCSRPLLKRTTDGVVDVWHPDPNDHGCPPMPDPHKDWPAYAALINAGKQPGHPDPEHFLPVLVGDGIADDTEALDIAYPEQVCEAGHTGPLPPLPDSAYGPDAIPLDPPEEQP